MCRVCDSLDKSVNSVCRNVSEYVMCVTVCMYSVCVYMCVTVCYVCYSMCDSLDQSVNSVCRNNMITTGTSIVTE
jgi:hypothetical protein